MIHLGTQALEGSTNTHKKDFLSVTPESVSQTQTLDSGRKNLGREEQKKKKNQQPVFFFVAMRVVVYIKIAFCPDE